MKKRALLTALTLGLVGIGSAHAQPPRDHPVEGKDRGEAMFKMLDSNDDGSLSADELKQMHSKMAQMRFAQADSDGDGQIDHDEFMARADKRADAMFKRLDKDGSGTLAENEAKPPHHRWHGKHGDHKHAGRNDRERDQSTDQSAGTAELRRRHGGLMSRLDSDGNGMVSRDEWNAGMQKMHHRRHDQGNGGIS